MSTEHLSSTGMDCLSAFCVKQLRWYNNESSYNAQLWIAVMASIFSFQQPQLSRFLIVYYAAKLWESQFYPYSWTFPHTRLVVTRRFIIVILSTVFGTSSNGNTHEMNDSSKCFPFCQLQLVALEKMSQCTKNFQISLRNTACPRS